MTFSANHLLALVRTVAHVVRVALALQFVVIVYVYGFAPTGETVEAWLGYLMMLCGGFMLLEAERRIENCD